MKYNIIRGETFWEGMMIIFRYEEFNSSVNHFVIAKDEEQALNNLRKMKINPSSVRFINSWEFDVEEGFVISAAMLGTK